MISSANVSAAMAATVTRTSPKISAAFLDSPQRANHTHSHSADSGQKAAQQTHEERRRHAQHQDGRRKKQRGQHSVERATQDGDSITGQAEDPSVHPQAQSPEIPPSTKKSTARSEKPMAFSTASSAVRSRTEMAIVLPVTSSSVKNTTDADGQGSETGCCRIA